MCSKEEIKIPTGYNETFNAGTITDTDNVIYETQSNGVHYYIYEAANSEGTHLAKINYTTITAFKCDSTYKIQYKCND